jgi:hypothetical protein
MGWHWLISMCLAVLAFAVCSGVGLAGVWCAAVAVLVFFLYWLGVAVILFDWNPGDFLD